MMNSFKMLLTRMNFLKMTPYCCMVLIIIWWWWCKILVLPPFYFWYPRLRDSYENGALMTLSVRGRATKRDSGHHFWAIKPTSGEFTKGPPCRRPIDDCHPFLPEPAKLIATDLVTHPVTCVIDIYIHMFTWLLFWGLGGICWINS